MIGSRGKLNDRLAFSFNQEFYGAVQVGKPVPEAYTEAMKVIREQYPASAWHVLMLLRGPELIEEKL